MAKAVAISFKEFRARITQKMLAERNYSGSGFLTASSVQFADARNIIPSVAEAPASAALVGIRPPSLLVLLCTAPNCH